NNFLYTNNKLLSGAIISLPISFQTSTNKEVFFLSKRMPSSIVLITFCVNNALFQSFSSNPFWNNSFVNKTVRQATNTTCPFVISSTSFWIFTCHSCVFLVYAYYKWNS